MKKAILIVAVIVALAAVAGVYYLYTNLDSLVAAAIEKYGSQATQTAVQVRNVNIQPTEGSATIGGLTVANPQGYSTPYAFTLRDIGTRVDFKNSSRDKIVIEEITIDNPEIFYEINRDRKTNLIELKNNISGDKPAAREQETPPAEQPNLVIRRLSFTGGNVHANIGPLDKQYELQLPAIRMTNLGGENGAPPAEIARQILSQLLDRVTREVQARGVGQELEKARQKLETQKQELKSRAGEALESRKEEARDKLKNLLKQ
ncbi:MAG TPA: hypothetical protein VF268_14505 [Gammaproteobacteria bacterium]|jgi:hypothetical protein